MSGYLPMVGNRFWLKLTLILVWTLSIYPFHLPSNANSLFLSDDNTDLSIVTKAGVPNNKVFVGEASYGRSFRMATDGCWGPVSTCRRPRVSFLGSFRGPATFFSEKTFSRMSNLLTLGLLRCAISQGPGSNQMLIRDAAPKQVAILGTLRSTRLSDAAEPLKHFMMELPIQISYFIKSVNFNPCFLPPDEGK